LVSRQWVSITTALAVLPASRLATTVERVPTAVEKAAAPRGIVTPADTRFQSVLLGRFPPAP
jgi:hypothetical protein